jgi:hypothetical protein
MHFDSDLWPRKILEMLGENALGIRHYPLGRGEVNSILMRFFGQPAAASQYFGTLGSTRSDHAVIPPARL